MQLAIEERKTNNCPVVQCGQTSFGRRASSVWKKR